jgi:hypothetical protein
MKNHFSALTGRRLVFGPWPQAGPAQLVLAHAHLRSSGPGARRSPSCSRAPLPNREDAPAAWTRRTGGHGRWPAGRSEPWHRDGNTSRFAPDRALTPAPAPASPRASHFENPQQEHSTAPPLAAPPPPPASRLRSIAHAPRCATSPLL